MKRALILLVVGVVAAGWWYAGRSSGPRTMVKGRLTGDGAGQAAPDFVMATPDGKLVRLSDFRGKVVVLNFWATWCPPCIEETPLLNHVQKTYQRLGVEVIAAAVDSPKEEIAAYEKKYNVSFRIVVATDELLDAYGNTRGLPNTFFIDTAGNVVEHVIGPIQATPTYDLVKQLIGWR